MSFDGVYRNSDMWLNGVYLGHHNSGYTSFHYYLHNASVVYGGGDNVLVVRADAFSAQEGWYVMPKSCVLASRRKILQDSPLPLPST